jgi:hypothetical protein
LLSVCFALAASSCIKEDMSKCVRENTTILFKYTGTDKSDIFLRDIASVDAFVFDEAKKLVVRRRFESQELGEFAGWRLNLSPGDYYVVCWGNAGDNSQFNSFTENTTTLDESFIRIPAHVTTTGDPMYHAPYNPHPQWLPEDVRSRAGEQAYGFTVLAGTNNVKEVNFVRAHRTVNVYIMGYSNDGGNRPPVVGGTNLCAEYNFYNNSNDVYRNFIQTARPISTPEGQAFLATFHFGFSEITDAMNFTVGQGNAESILQTVNLKKFIEDNPSAYGNTINIMVRFSDMGVTITIPEWGGGSIEPGV